MEQREQNHVLHELCESLWRRERSVDLLLSCVPLVASVTLRDAERFDAKKEANTCPFLGARKERKEHPPSPRPLPIWRGCNLKVAETDDFQWVLVSRDTA